jgi:prefoldin subunit 5
VLEAVAKVYLADVDERDNGARRARLQKLEETNRTYCAEVERFRSRLDTIARALGSRDAATLAVMDSFLKDELREAIRGLKAGDEGARARLDEIQKAIGKHGEYRIELENLRSQIGQTEKLQNSLAETIERLRIELGAPPRVTLAEEAAPRRPR